MLKQAVAREWLWLVACAVCTVVVTAGWQSVGWLRYKQALERWEQRVAAIQEAELPEGSVPVTRPGTAKRTRPDGTVFELDLSGLPDQPRTFVPDGPRYLPEELVRAAARRELERSPPDRADYLLSDFGGLLYAGAALYLAIGLARFTRWSIRTVRT